MLFSTMQTLSFLSALALPAIVSASQVGASGTLSSLDGGLGGVVTVASDSSLEVTQYKLADASAPELYWWGSTSSDLSSGFRISNTHITEAATSDSLTINLDAGHTPADFSTVGLWCEKFKTNFGQAQLAASTTGTSSSNNSQTTTGAAAPARTTTGAGSANSIGVMFAIAAMAAGVVVPALL
ncbi:hypothetical protein CI102_4518 [Trichoderma harzianum]|uniref:DM13 domain-containing protein n=1 Tax=Trichoderma harzianum CBS 226.95 TaxID=983964 RepID=A0A2T3ZT84_TRIHA|nr:hypothetical protein M431DRAFT_488107 [Trichoderma harzianum CBS 226.95]PKK51922.1 hypothetical protein CI102_4518 [Trichoderma harzianum]PTB48007.1 hypothetical protein M431DRAFT_488107 [Trichoderma harzianum CBS 226.95]